jgi:hypothetical protein
MIFKTGFILVGVLGLTVLVSSCSTPGGNRSARAIASLGEETSEVKFADFYSTHKAQLSRGLGNPMDLCYVTELTGSYTGNFGFGCSAKADLHGHFDYVPQKSMSDVSSKVEKLPTGDIRHKFEGHFNGSGDFAPRFVVVADVSSDQKISNLVTRIDNESTVCYCSTSR